MKKLLKHLVALIAVMMVTVIAAGCGLSGTQGTATQDGDKILFTYDGTEVSFKEAWIYTKMTATQYEAYYSQYFGENFWSMSMDESGATMEDNVKESTVNQIKKIIVLVNRASDYECSLTDDEKKQANEYAKAFAEDPNGKTILEECGANVDDIQKIYEDNMLAHKVQEAMIKDVDTEVSEDEARETKVNRVHFETTTTDEESGEEKELSDKEKKKLKKKAEAALKDLKSGKKTIKEIAEENDFSDSMEETYAAGESEEGQAFEEAIKKLKDGDILDKVMDTDQGYVIAQLVAYTDKEATEENKESIIEERQENAFSDKYDELTRDLEEDWDYDKDVDQDLMAQLTLADQSDEATTGTTTETEAAENDTQVTEESSQVEGNTQVTEESGQAAEESSQAVEE